MSFDKETDSPVLRLSPDDFSLRDAASGGGVAVLGCIGAGKTSGSARAIAKAFLREGVGGFVLNAKNQDTGASALPPAEGRQEWD